MTLLGDTFDFRDSIELGYFRSTLDLRGGYSAMKNGISIVLGVIAFLSGSVSVALADNNNSSVPGVSQPGGDHGHRKKFLQGKKDVLMACAKEYQVALPAKNSGERMSAGDRSAIHSCIQRFHDDMKACLDVAGIQPSKNGGKLQRNAATKAAFKACHDKSLSQVSSGPSVSG